MQVRDVSARRDLVALAGEGAVLNVLWGCNELVVWCLSLGVLCGEGWAWFLAVVTSVLT